MEQEIPSEDKAIPQMRIPNTFERDTKFIMLGMFIGGASALAAVVAQKHFVKDLVIDNNVFMEEYYGG